MIFGGNGVWVRDQGCCTRCLQTTMARFPGAKIRLAGCTSTVRLRQHEGGVVGRSWSRVSRNRRQSPKSITTLVLAGASARPGQYSCAQRARKAKEKRAAALCSEDPKSRVPVSVFLRSLCQDSVLVLSAIVANSTQDSRKQFVKAREGVERLEIH